MGERPAVNRDVAGSNPVSHPCPLGRPALLAPGSFRGRDRWSGVNGRCNAGNLITGPGELAGGDWSNGTTLGHNEQNAGSIPASPSMQWLQGSTPTKPLIWAGSDNGNTPGLHPGDRGSTPRRSTENATKVHVVGTLAWYVRGLSSILSGGFAWVTRWDAGRPPKPAERGSIPWSPATAVIQTRAGCW